MTTLRTSATTTAGIARAWVRSNGSTIAGPMGRSVTTRDHDAIREADGTWTITGATGTRREPQGSVVLARGVRVEAP